MPRLLITGASGLLGANLAHLAATDHEVVAVSGHRRLQLAGVLCAVADLSEADRAHSLLEHHQPDWLIHCAAATDLERCEREPDWAQALNIEVPRSLAIACRSFGVRLVHISTDSVFDGDKATAYTEEEQPYPVNVYARSKRQGELAVQEANPQALIVRTNFFGWTISPRHSLVEWFLGRLEHGDSAPGFADVTFSPLLVDHLARSLLRLLELGAHGLLHLPGATCVSKYEFGVRLAETFGLAPELVQRASIAQSSLTVRRPLRTCLNGARVERLLGEPLPAIEDGLALLRRTRAQRMTLRETQPRLEELAHESD